MPPSHRRKFIPQKSIPLLAGTERDELRWSNGQPPYSWRTALSALYSGQLKASELLHLAQKYGRLHLK